MTKIFIFILSISLSLKSFAFNNDFYCKADYQKKFERIEDNVFARNLPTVALGISGGVIIPLMVFGIGIGSPIIGIPLLIASAAIPLSLPEILDRKNGLYQAYSAQELAELSESEVFVRFIEEVKKARRELVKDKNFIKRKLREQNNIRFEVGEAPLTEEMLIEKILNAPLPKERPKNGIDLIAKKLNRKLKREDIPALSYNQIRELILAQKDTDFFCPNGRPITAGKASRSFFKRLKE